MYKILEDCELEVTESYDEVTDTGMTNLEIFHKDEVVDFDIYDDLGDTVHIQFGDGAVAFFVPKSLFCETTGV